MIDQVNLKVSKKKEVTTTNEDGADTVYSAELTATKGVMDIEKVTVRSSEPINLREGEIVTMYIGRIQKQLVPDQEVSASTEE